MENVELFIASAAAAASLFCLAYVLVLHKKMNNFMDSIAEELSETFFDYVRVSDRLDELEEILEKNKKIIRPEPDAGSKDILTKKLFIKKSLFNLDIPKSRNVSPEALEDLFNSLIEQRWWKKPRNED